MQPFLPIAPFAGLLADLANDLRRGVCCLVIADKGWVNFLYRDVFERLRATGVNCVFINGRPAENDPPDDTGVMLVALRQLRKATRSLEEEGKVVVLPHLDVMATKQDGWTSISREMVPLLYEDPAMVLLGFRDPSLPLLPVVDKLFQRKYLIDQPFRPPFPEHHPAAVSTSG